MAPKFSYISYDFLNFFNLYIHIFVYLIYIYIYLPWNELYALHSLACERWRKDRLIMLDIK